MINKTVCMSLLGLLMVSGGISCGRGSSSSRDDHTVTADEYGVDGFNAEGFNKSGVHKFTGRDHNALGFNKAGIHFRTGTPFSPAGYDRFGYDRAGFNEAGVHRDTGNKYSPAGFDLAGIHRDTQNRFNPEGYDRAGYDRHGRNAAGNYFSVFGEYANSEAEALKIGYEYRINRTPNGRLTVIDFSGGFLQEARIGQQSYNSGDAPGEQDIPYFIRNQDLALRIGAELGTPFGVGDTLSSYELNHLIAESLRDAIRSELNDGMVGSVGTVFVGFTSRPATRVFKLDPLPLDQEAYQILLLEKVEDTIRTFGIRRVNLNPNQGVNVSLRGPAQNHFLELLNAIQNNNEVNFLNHLSWFSDQWGVNTLAARNAFFGSFTTLFVSKRFPSKALRGAYFHYIWHCGQISS